MMFSSNKNDIYALKKDQFISISFEIPKVQTSSKEKKVEPIKEETVEEIQEIKDVNVMIFIVMCGQKKLKNKRKKRN